MRKHQKINPLASTFPEKLMYGIGDAGGAVLLSFPGSYLTLYLTDSVGMAAAFAGSMMLICRIFDGISDAFMGMVIDLTHTKWGKARPWFVLSILPLILSFIALFCMPARLSESARQIYITVLYFLMTVVFYTINNIAYHSMLQRFSLSSEDRGKVSAVRSILVVIIVAVYTVLTPLQIRWFGGEDDPNTWKQLALMWGAVCTICLSITAFGIKEKLSAQTPEPQAAASASSAHSGGKEALSHLLHCRYFYLLCGLSVIYFTLSNLRGMSFYYVRDVLGSADLLSLIAAITVIPTLIFAPFLPMLYQKIGKKNMSLLGLILCAAGSMIILFDTRNIILAIISQTLRTIGLLPLGTALSTLAGDIADYLQMKTGIRSDGVTTSAHSVGVKIGTGLGAATVAWALTLGRYDSALSVQPDSALQAMIAVNSYVPALLCAAGLLMLMFWNLEKYQGEVRHFMEKLKADNDQTKEM